MDKSDVYEAIDSDNISNISISQTAAGEWEVFVTIVVPSFVRDITEYRATKQVPLDELKDSVATVCKVCTPVMAKICGLKTK